MSTPAKLPVTYIAERSPFSEGGMLGAWSFPAETMAAFEGNTDAVMLALRQQPELFDLMVIPASGYREREDGTIEPLPFSE